MEGGFLLSQNIYELRRHFVFPRLRKMVINLRAAHRTAPIALCVRGIRVIQMFIATEEDGDRLIWSAKEREKYAARAGCENALQQHQLS